MGINEKRPTRGDVAKLAGVATGTVSRVLSDAPNVDPTIRDKVIRAITELDYKPNMVARSLRANQTKLIGHFAYPLTVNPSNAYLASGIQEAAAAEGYAIMMSDNALGVDAFISAALSWRVDALILSQNIPVGDIVELHKDDITVVGCGFEIHSSLNLPWVEPDYAKASRESVTYLVDLGHRRIGLLSGDTNVASNKCLTGWLSALREAGLEPVAVRGGGYRAEQALGEADSLLREGVTAILCADDVMAISAINVARSRGMAVPGDISIIGFGDIWPSNFTVPGLSTVRVPLFEMGKKAVQLALDHKRNRYTGNIILPTELVVRGTTGPVTS